jgi:hypothetical protein
MYRDRAALRLYSVGLTGPVLDVEVLDITYSGLDLMQTILGFGRFDYAVDLIGAKGSAGSVTPDGMNVII